MRFLRRFPCAVIARGQRSRGGSAEAPRGAPPLARLAFHEGVTDFVFEAGAGFLEAVLLQLAFPDLDDLPAVSLHGGTDLDIALAVAGELRLPIFDVLFWRGGIFAAFVVMPETSHDVDGDLAARIGDVGVAMRLLPIEAITWKAHVAQHLAHEKLRLGVTSLVALHRLAHRIARSFGDFEFDVPVVDLFTMSRDFLTKTGDEASKKYYMNLAPGEANWAPEGKIDNSHLKYEGAMLYTGMIAKGLKDLGGVYASLLADDELNKETTNIEING